MIKKDSIFMVGHCSITKLITRNVEKFSIIFTRTIHVLTFKNVQIHNSNQSNFINMINVPSFYQSLNCVDLN